MRLAIVPQIETPDATLGGALVRRPDLEAGPPVAVLPVLVADEAAADRIFTAGAQSFTQALRRNRSTIEGMGQSRRPGRG
mgnify:CR=1 FL=1